MWRVLRHAGLALIATAGLLLTTALAAGAERPRMLLLVNDPIRPGLLEELARLGDAQAIEVDTGFVTATLDDVGFVISVTVDDRDDPSVVGGLHVLCQ